MKNSGSRGALAWVGLWAGVVVGLVDGARAGVVTGADASGTLLAAVLCGAVDAWLGLIFGAAAGLVMSFLLWGRRVRSSAGSTIAAGAVLGLAAAAAVSVAVLATADRRSRFLAAGIAALVAGASGAGAALMVPALARLLSLVTSSGGLGRSPAPRPTALAWLIVPVALFSTVATVFEIVLTMRPPVTVPLAISSSGLAAAALVTAGVPLLLHGLRRLGPGARLRVRPTAALTAGLFSTGAIVFSALDWNRHLRFLPWTHIAVAAAILGVTLLVTIPRGTWSARRFVPTATWSAVTTALTLAVSLLASESEPARKAAFARAGLTGPVLTQARRLFDRDRDGYSRWFGGGDCDDTDATVHPGVLDYPDDGVDQDCDGRDARAATLVPPRFGAVPASVPRELNLLLITIDTVRADHLGTYGYPRPTSPEIDRLAAEGSLFVNGWAHAPSTRYSMPAIATGRWPSSITWDESIWWPRIAPGVRTLGEALKAAGYFTAAFYSFEYFALADHRGFERGIDLYRADRAVLHQSVNGPMESRGSSSQQMADDGIAFFESHLTGKVFLWLHFYDPHLSYEPHAEVPSFGRERMDLYDGEIRFTDLHLGRLFRRLKELGLWGRTAIVITGDHGEGFGEHGITEHGFDLYPAQTKVPFIIRVPGLPPQRLSRPAGHVELAPTLLNLARAPQEPSFLGRSVVPELAGGDAAGEPSSPAPVVFQEVTSERGKKRALVSRDTQVIWNWTPDNTTECYDLARDPGANRDLWGRADAPQCRRLKLQLQEMVSILSLPAGLGSKLKAGVYPRGAALPPPPRTPLAAQVGDDVRVVGHSASASKVHAGQAVDIDLHLECLRPIPAGWRPFFHVLGPGGFFRNIDHVPVQGAMPLERWRPGQRIVDQFQVMFPQGATPGRYRLIFGLFQGSRRQPVTPPSASDGNSAVRVLEIELD